MAVFFLGISSGFPLTLILATLTYWLSKEGVSKGEVGLFATILAPYSLKFIWAPLIDRLQIPMLTRLVGQRRSWLLVCQAVLVVAVIGLGQGDPTQDLGTMAAFALLVAIASATQDIVIDAYRIEILESEEEQGLGAAMINFGYRTGNLIAGAGAVYLASIEDGLGLGWGLTYSIMSLLVLAGAGAAFAIGEPARQGSEEADAQEARAKAWLKKRDGPKGMLTTIAAWLYATVAAPFIEFLSRPYSVLIIIFLVVYKLGDAMANLMINPLIVELGFSDADYIWANKLVGFWALICGTAVGGLIIKRVGMFTSLMGTGFLMAVSNLLFSGLAYLGDEPWALAVAIGFENFASGMGLTALVAYLSSLTNVAYTATHYAMLSAIAIAARNFLSAPSGFLAEATGWPLFFLLTTLVAFPGLAILWWMWRVGLTGGQATKPSQK